MTKKASNESTKLSRTRLTIVSISLADITPDPQNTNGHGERNLRGIAGSFARFGQQEPLVLREATDDDRERGVATRYVTVAGEGRVTAVKLLHEGFYDAMPFTKDNPQAGKWQTLDCVITTLADLEAMGYAIAANQTNRTSENKWEVLAVQIKALQDFDARAGREFHLDTIGFEKYEVMPLLKAEWQPAAIDPAGLDVARSAPTPPPAPTSGPAGVDEDDEEAPPPSAPGYERLTGTPADPGDNANNASPIIVTPNMRVTIDRAVENFRIINGDDSITEGRAVELICADYNSRN